ncbi:unnamed protein product [Rhizoctonia solani]|uniref:Uncharacterized protein n=1 Tax=Rhizoctonia solani TaxID=456999 RepID=A0A8H3HEK5_9AGAM|nr:unnamed protein product [Rhizoctonia solani]
MASEEPLFDPSLKKRKKKAKVNFDEDPLGADAAPAEPETPAVPPPADIIPPASILKSSEPPKEDDLDAMFGDLKKKKKKKEIPLDLELDGSVPASGDATPATGGGDDLEFGGLKKKKKGKKAAFDLEAFEKELADSKAKEGDEDEDDGPAPEMDEGDLGEDVFAQAAPEGGAQIETWHGTDRDYTYGERWEQEDCVR